MDQLIFLHSKKYKARIQESGLLYSISYYLELQRNASQET